MAQQSDTRSKTLVLCEGNIWVSKKTGKQYPIAAYTNAASCLRAAELDERNWEAQYGERTPEPCEGMSPEEIRAAHDQHLAVEESLRQLHLRQFWGEQLCRENPSYVNNLSNAGALNAQLRNDLRAAGRVFPLWNMDDLNHAADFLASQGALELRGSWRRKTPTAQQMEKMSLSELKARSDGNWEEED